MLKTHDEAIVVYPDSPAEIKQTIEENDAKLSVPSQLWMASQMAYLAEQKQDPQVLQYYKDIKTAQLYDYYYKMTALYQKKRFVPRVSDEDALHARGMLSTQQHVARIAGKPQSAAFRTYGRDYPTTYFKTSILGTSEPGKICPRTFIERRPPVVKLQENQAGKPAEPKMEKQEGNAESMARIQDSSLYHKSILQKCKPNGAQSACFQSPERGEVAPNICKLTANEETNAQFRARTPIRTGQREFRAKDEHSFVIDQQKAATLCRTTLLKQGQLASHSPLKGYIYPPRYSSPKKYAYSSTWYLNSYDANILANYAEKRAQMMRDADRRDKRVRDMDEYENYQFQSVEHYQNIRERMAERAVHDVEVRQKTKSPWEQWGLPEKAISRQKSEIAQTNKRVDAAQALTRYKQEAQAAAYEVQRNEERYFSQVYKEEGYRRKKMGTYYYPDKTASNAPAKRSPMQQPFNGYAKTAQKFDLLKENKYINENVDRPMDMQLVAKLRRQNNELVVDGARGNQTVSSEYAMALKQQHRAMSSKFNKFYEQTLLYRRPESTSYRGRNQSQITAVPARSANLKNQDLSKQLPRSSPCRARNYVNLAPTENFLEVDRLQDKDIRQAQSAKFAFANEMQGLVKDYAGKELSAQANQMLMEQMGNRLKLMRQRDSVGVLAVQEAPKSVNDLKPKICAPQVFAKQSGRDSPERSGQKNLMITVTERERRIKEDNADVTLTFQEMSRYKIDQMAVSLYQGEEISGFKPSYIVQQQVQREAYERHVDLYERVEKERGYFYAYSAHTTPKTFTFAQSGREMLANKFVAQTTTNISIGSSSLLVYEGTQLKMSQMNYNFFDYQAIIDPTYTYKSVNGTKTLVKNFSIQDRNDHTRLSAEAAMNIQCDVSYSPKSMDDVYGKGNKAIGFGHQVGRKKTDLHVNDLQYDVKHGVVELRACDMVNIGKQSGRK